MTKREKLLGAGVLAIVVILGLRAIHGRVESSVSQADSQRKAAEDKLEEIELEIYGGEKAAKRLANYRERSLPPNDRKARSQYLNWLQSELDDAGIEGINVISSLNRSMRDGYKAISYTASGNGSLDQVIDFLHRFYRANHLHKIRTLNINPEDGGKRFALNAVIEALVVDGSVNEAGLSDAVSERVAESVDPYTEKVVKRNIFTRYVPPPPKRVVVQREPEPEPPPEPPFDHAEHARFSGFAESGGKIKAWVNVNTTGKKHRFAAGDQFEIGTLKGKVVRISHFPGQLIYESEGKQYSVRLGQNLRDGKAVEPDPQT